MAMFVASPVPSLRGGILGFGWRAELSLPRDTERSIRRHRTPESPDHLWCGGAGQSDGRGSRPRTSARAAIRPESPRYGGELRRFGAAHRAVAEARRPRPVFSCDE